MKSCKRLRLLGAALVLVGLQACGYVFLGGGSALPVDVRRVYIPVVENETPEAGLSGVVTEALRDRFERYGVLYVVDRVQDADAVLNARVISVKRERRTTTSETDTALQYDTVMVLGGELIRTTGPLLWRNDRIMVSKSFGTTSESVVTSSADFSASSLNPNDLAGLNTREISRGQEAQAFEVLAEEAARMMYNEAVAPDF